ncbi:Gfo/Idh/MocA family oxidoreductase [Ruficoccus amylovorans]|uniref:Gfo/Idh/MocA family oxidoreductase n=1 Tax=Ruficoccus amylovorans TaxID=1804625 RepID=A0A842HC34_9BACT|nr:Gfo/Idh/MocA family oxidoreductase [Ruficoccus amylovorans]MBC2593177.1 Gfo/Idh/MocA family oxidoreductase [Ruficoccus amylovorans]
MKKSVIVGMGFMGAMHAQIYAQLENATLVGVVDFKGAAAKEKLDGLGMPGVPVFATVEEAFEALDFDVLDICLPTDLHLEFALKGIAAGKAVFCEKPLALSTEDAERISTAAAEAGVPFQVGQCIRFWPEYQALREFHASGQGGKLLSLTMQRRSARPTYAEGDWLNQEIRSKGAAFDLHIHDTDFVLALLGEPRAVTSHGHFDASGPSHIFTHYAYDGPVVYAEGGWNYPDTWGFQMAFQALYENATIDYDSGAQPTLSITVPGTPKAALPFASAGQRESSFKGGNLSDLGGYYKELEAFIHCLENGSAITDATAGQATASVRVALAEIESARSGQTVSL